MRTKQGKFQKGHNLGGRPKGSVAPQLRALAKKLNEKALADLLENFESLTTNEKIRLLSITLKHSVPALQAVDAELNHSTPQSWFELSTEIKKELIKAYYE